MPPERGSVVLVLFPDSTLRTAKRRPALVVQADHLGTGIPQAIVAMITSNMARAGHPSRVAVSLQTPEGRASGLKTDSVIMTDNCGLVGGEYPIMYWAHEGRPPSVRQLAASFADFIEGFLEYPAFTQDEDAEPGAAPNRGGS